MTNRKIIFILLALISFSIKSQDIIEHSKLTVNGVNILGQHKSILTSKFGKPSKITEDYSDIEDKSMYIYKYSGFEIYVIDDVVESFEIIGNNYQFTFGSIKIGDDISKVKNKFPNSYKERKKDYLIINLKEVDKFVSVEFNSISNNISKINIDNY